MSAQDPSVRTFRRGLWLTTFSSKPGPGDLDLFERTADIARRAEAAGIHALFVMEHLIQSLHFGPSNDPMPEAYTMLSGLAARTERMKLGALVTGVTYRNPALLAKTVTTLDVISGGRAILGIGGAWFQPDHDTSGYEFPPAAQRLGRLEETLEICRGMFSGAETSFEGKWHRTAGVTNYPAPLTPGGPPILIGGGGEKKTLRLVAKYADAWNLTLMSPEDTRHKIEVLEKHCNETDRDASTITKTFAGSLVVADSDQEAQRWKDAVLQERCVVPSVRPIIATQFIAGGAERVTEQIGKYLDVGMDSVVMHIPETDPEAIERTGAVLRLALPD